MFDTTGMDELYAETATVEITLHEYRKLIFLAANQPTETETDLRAKILLQEQHIKSLHQQIDILPKKPAKSTSRAAKTAASDDPKEDDR